MLADLTTEERQLVDKLAVHAGKDVALHLRESLLVLAGKFQDEAAEAPAGLLSSIAAKLTDHDEEVSGVRVGTLKRIAAGDIPTRSQLRAATKTLL